MTRNAWAEDLDLSPAFRKHLGMFAHPRGANLIERTKPLGDWIRQRIDTGTWPYARALQQAPSTTTTVESQTGVTVQGMNFGSQDYLGLASHPAVYEAAIAALAEYGPHSAASPMLQGNTALSRALEQDLGELLRSDHVLLFPTGWAAGFGTIVALVRSNDHVVIDQLAHACLMQGARAATPNHHFFRHNDVAHVRETLRAIRASDSRHAILVVSEGLFSMDSDSPDISGLQDACSEYGAALMLDVAHDLGASGPGGAGQVGLQKMLGRVDLVMGSFSKTFASNGGFLATRDLSVKQYVGIYGGPHAFSNALSPMQAGVARAAVRIVRSEEGEGLRRKAMRNIRRLRDSFTRNGVQCLGDPSNVVPVTVGDEKLAKCTSRLLEEKGLIANLVEFPAVARGAARFRFQVMASHAEEEMETAVDVFSRALRGAGEVARLWSHPGEDPGPRQARIVETRASEV